MELPCIPESVSLVRAGVARVVGDAPFTPTEIDDIILAVGEAAANAVRHGLRYGEESAIRVCCCADSFGVCIEITDRGDGFDPERLRAPSLGSYAEGGMGIYLMRRVMDEVSYTFDSRGTTVRLVKKAHVPIAAELPALCA